MVYTLRFFSSKCTLFHNSNVFGSVFFTFYKHVVLKLKKNNSGAKTLNMQPAYILLNQDTLLLSPKQLTCSLTNEIIITTVIIIIIIRKVTVAVNVYV